MWLADVNEHKKQVQIRFEIMPECYTDAAYEKLRGLALTLCNSLRDAHWGEHAPVRNACGMGRVEPGEENRTTLFNTAHEFGHPQGYGKIHFYVSDVNSSHSTRDLVIHFIARDEVQLRLLVNDVLASELAAPLADLSRQAIRTCKGFAAPRHNHHMAPAIMQGMDFAIRRHEGEAEALRRDQLLRNAGQSYGMPTPLVVESPEDKQLARDVIRLLDVNSMAEATLEEVHAYAKAQRTNPDPQLAAAASWLTTEIEGAYSLLQPSVRGIEPHARGGIARHAQGR